MEMAVSLLVLLWLGIISWFDLRKREVPHSAWTVIPFIAALIYRAWLGDWQLTVLAIVVAVISERSWLAERAKFPLDNWILWFPPLILSISWSILNYPIGTLSILGFWAAWELRCWGGADAVAAMVIVLLWPTLFLILALLMVHVLAVLVATLISFLKEHRLRTHMLPGLPLLFVTAVLYLIIQ